MTATLGLDRTPGARACVISHHNPATPLGTCPTHRSRLVRWEETPAKHVTNPALTLLLPDRLPCGHCPASARTSPGTESTLPRERSPSSTPKC